MSAVDVVIITGTMKHRHLDTILKYLKFLRVVQRAEKQYIIVKSVILKNQSQTEVCQRDMITQIVSSEKQRVRKRALCEAYATPVDIRMKQKYRQKDITT